MESHGNGSYVAQLRCDHKTATVATLPELRKLAAKYGCGLSAANRSQEAWRTRLMQQLEELIAAETGNGRANRRTQPQLSAPASPVAVSPVARRVSGAGRSESRGNYTPPRSLGTPPPPPRVGGSTSGSYRDALNSITKKFFPLGSTPKPKGPAKFLGAAQSPVLVLQDGSGPGAEQPSNDDAIAAMQRQLAALQMEVSQLKQDKVALQQQVQQLSQQMCMQTATADTHQKGLQALQGELQQQQALQSTVSQLAAKQQQLAEQHERAVCQKAVVIKVPEALPSGSAGARAAQQLLQSKLQLSELRVAKLRPLGNPQLRGKGGRHAYQAVLTDAKQRDDVLSRKAKALKGTSISIDPLLTTQQQREKLQLLPLAKQAAKQGSRVQWRYSQLLVNGQQVQNEGDLLLATLPRPAAAPTKQPHAARRSSQQSARQTSPAKATDGGSGSKGRGITHDGGTPQAAAGGKRGDACPRPKPTPPTSPRA